MRSWIYRGFVFVLGVVGHAQGLFFLPGFPFCRSPGVRVAGFFYLSPIGAVDVIVPRVGILISLYFCVFGELCPAQGMGPGGLWDFPSGASFAKLRENVTGDVQCSGAKQRPNCLAGFSIGN